MQALSVQDLVKWYEGRDRVLAIDRVRLDVHQGELLVLLGPSGCGKTTLLRCVAGLEDAQGGRITLGERMVFDATGRFNVPTHKRDIGMVFQNYSLWPHMTVRQNIQYPLKARGVRRAERDRRVRDVLAAVQCGPLADRLPSMLSGGQQQRIALARALVSRPAIMLLDEPLSNLDALLRVELRSQLRAVHRELGFTGLYVTHDQGEAFALGTRVAVMNNGRIEQQGTAEEVYSRPATEYVARFLGIRNALPLSYENGWRTPAGPLGGDPGLPQDGAGPMQLFVRPEAVRLFAADGPRQPDPGELRLAGGRIMDAWNAGGAVDYVVQLESATLHASMPGSSPEFRQGDLVCASFDPAHTFVYSDGRLISGQSR